MTMAKWEEELLQWANQFPVDEEVKIDMGEPDSHICLQCNKFTACEPTCKHCGTRIICFDKNGEEVWPV